MIMRHECSLPREEGGGINNLWQFWLLHLLLMGGCFYIGKNQIEDIVETPSSEWSSRDGLTILMQPMANNLLDLNSPVVKVIATPYYSAVIMAINRTEQRTKHLSEEEFEMNMDQQFREDLGLYIDWKAHRLVDGRGYYYKSLLQLDSLAFLISISNTSWPCVSPMIVSPAGIFPMFGPNNFPCYTPDISHLGDNIYLINDRNDSLRVKSVWGRRWDQLLSEETILAKFELRKSNRHFLDSTNTFYLVISGFDRPLPTINLSFPIVMMKMSFRQF